MTLLRVLIIVNVIALLNCLTVAQSISPEAPADYPYDSDAGRVNNLVKFFETLDVSSKTNEQKSSIITLTEAAEKLHIFIGDTGLASMCSRYYKLIVQPNVRTLPAVRELADEHLDEIQQPDANILMKLISERQFDALGRILTIMSSLESEKEADGTSSYSAAVQNDLFDCLEYLIYRHDQVTAGGLVGYISDRRSAIGTTTPQKREPPASNKYQPLMDRIVAIEEREFSHPNDYRDWIEALTELQEMALQDGLMIPVSVEQFLKNQQRLNTLKLYAQMLDKAETYKKALQDFEKGVASDKCKTIDDYVTILNELNNLIDENLGKFPPFIVDFAKHPTREAFVDKSYLENYENGQINGKCSNIQDYIALLANLNEKCDQNENAEGPKIAKHIVDFVRDPARKAFIDMQLLRDFEQGNKRNPECQDIKDYTNILDDLRQLIEDNPGNIEPAIVEFAKHPNREAFIDMKTLENYEDDIPSRYCATIDEYKKLLDKLNQTIDLHENELDEDIVEFGRDPARQRFIKKNERQEAEKVPYVSENPDKNADKIDVPLKNDEVLDCREWLGDLCGIKGRTVDLNNVHRYVNIFNKLEDLCYNRYEDATKYIDRKRQLFYEFINELSEWYNEAAPRHKSKPGSLTPGEESILERTKVFLDANKLRGVQLRKDNIIQ